MGLSVSVGDYAQSLRQGDDVAWFDEAMALVNQALREQGLPEHVEPRDIPDIPYRACIGFPYSFLHYLRRMHARQALGKAPEPVTGEDISAADEADIEEVGERFESHLLYHSDCEGFYVPVDFALPIDGDELPGGIVGSTQALLREVLALAPLVDVELAGGAPTAQALASLEAFDETHPYYIERVVWHALYENCTRSLEHRGVILFG